MERIVFHKESFSHTPFKEKGINSNEFNKSNSNSNTTSFKEKAQEIANRLRDPEPFFVEWALCHLPLARIEALVAVALERGRIPARYFNHLVKQELDN